jgi:hypothetical protein
MSASPQINPVEKPVAADQMQVQTSTPNDEKRSKLVFVHLSDIHFQADAGSPDDLDDDIRNQLVIDVVKLVSALPPVTAILVSGDIAGRGAAVEYEYARQWLDKLCAKLKVSTECVWTVPGNHDIDQEAQKNNEIARLARDELRRIELGDLDEKIARLHRDSGVLQALYAPIKNYNAFALEYGCAIDGTFGKDGATGRWWEAAFILDDGSSVLLRGVNSALISDATDDEHKSQLVVGSAGITMREQEGVVHILMCHHPPHWLRDRATLDGPIAGRACMHLFGHEHEQKVQRVGNSIRLFSGALHPHRRRAWVPQYNVIVLSATRSAGERTLKIDIHSRAWSKQEGKFLPDSAGESGVHSFQLPLSEWHHPVLVSEEIDAMTTAPDAPEGAPSISDKKEEHAPARIGRERRLAHRFYRLPIPTQWKIVREMGYLDLDRIEASSAAFFVAAFQRARTDKRLSELWKLVESAHGGAEAEPNPFEGS